MTWQVLADETPCARKRHFCDDCQRVIEAGETYRRVRAITDDGPRVYKSCGQCSAVLDHIWKHDPDARYYDDGIDLQEYLGEYVHESLLAEQFRSRWQGVEVGGIALADLGLVASGVTPQENR